MRISLRYVTRFVYPGQVWESHNVLKACPADNETQRLLDYGVAVEPAAVVLSHNDRWGTRVDTFGITEPHGELIVTAAASVETSVPNPPESHPTEKVSDPFYQDRIWEFLQPTRHTRWNSELALVAVEAVGGASDFVEAISRVESVVHTAMDYRPGSTEIGVDVEDVWANKEGVCQDFAHLTVAMLRSLGIGARYVSGYFFAIDPTAAGADESDEIVVATHAWVEAAIPGGQWWAIDPTNAASAGERHVKIGHGRDYDDVTPLRGVYYGETGHVASAEVTMSRGRITRHELPVPDQAALQQLQQQ